MELALTKEELKAIELYKNERYLMMNQLLVEDMETDIALLMAGNTVEYSKDSVAENIEMIKKIYEAMVKKYHQKEKEEWKFFRGTNIAEIERLNINPNINRFFLGMTTKESAKNQILKNTIRRVMFYILGNATIPYIQLEENGSEILIAPFTKVAKIEKIEESLSDEYKILLENQEFLLLSENEKERFYQSILEKADKVNENLQDCIKLENENRVHYENIRKLEQLLAKHNLAMEQEEYQKETTQTEKQDDLDDIQRIEKELGNLKQMVASTVKTRQEKATFIVNWKREVIQYMMAECGEIKNKYEEEKKELEPEIEQTSGAKKEEQTVQEPVKSEETISEEKEENPKITPIRLMCEENKKAAKDLLQNIKDLITKQQNHARIAKEINSNYKALNNAFEMKNFAEELESLINSLLRKINTMPSEKSEELDKIHQTSIQVSTLLNYLNNPKSAVGKKITRFDEIHIIEENALKRGIAETIKNIRCEAELKKLRDDIDIIEDKSKFQKFIGRFTGRNRLDEVMLDQIEIRQMAVRKTFKAKMPLAYNYSIHKLIAEMDMFIEENDDDELVEEDVAKLKSIKEILKKNFVIIDSKVISIIDQKTGRNLPLASGKISKRELIEIDTYRFLHKYGYDKSPNNSEPEYQDTLANEIKRIVDYMKSSEIL